MLVRPLLERRRPAHGGDGGGRARRSPQPDEVDARRGDAVDSWPRARARAGRGATSRRRSARSTQPALPPPADAAALRRRPTSPTRRCESVRRLGGRRLHASCRRSSSLLRNRRVKGARARGAHRATASRSVEALAYFLRDARGGSVGPAAHPGDAGAHPVAEVRWTRSIGALADERDGFMRYKLVTAIEPPAPLRPGADLRPRAVRAAGAARGAALLHVPVSLHYNLYRAASSVPARCSRGRCARRCSARATASIGCWRCSTRGATSMRRAGRSSTATRSRARALEYLDNMLTGPAAQGGPAGARGHAARREGAPRQRAASARARATSRRRCSS